MCQKRSMACSRNRSLILDPHPAHALMEPLYPSAGALDAGPSPCDIPPVPFTRESELSSVP